MSEKRRLRRKVEIVLITVKLNNCQSWMFWSPPPHLHRMAAGSPVLSADRVENSWSQTWHLEETFFFWYLSKCVRKTERLWFCTAWLNNTAASTTTFFLNETSSHKRAVIAIPAQCNGVLLESGATVPLLCLRCWIYLWLKDGLVGSHQIHIIKK